jgi:hypothetical protein
MSRGTPAAKAADPSGAAEQARYIFRIERIEQDMANRHVDPVLLDGLKSLTDH